MGPSAAHIYDSARSTNSYHELQHFTPIEGLKFQRKGKNGDPAEKGSLGLCVRGGEGFPIQVALVDKLL